MNMNFEKWRKSQFMSLGKNRNFNTHAKFILLEQIHNIDINKEKKRKG